MKILLLQSHSQSKLHSGWPVWVPKKMSPKSKQKMLLKQYFLLNCKVQFQGLFYYIYIFEIYFRFLFFFLTFFVFILLDDKALQH